MHRTSKWVLPSFVKIQISYQNNFSQDQVGPSEESFTRKESFKDSNSWCHPIQIGNQSKRVQLQLYPSLPKIYPIKTPNFQRFKIYQEIWTSTHGSKNFTRPFFLSPSCNKLIFQNGNVSGQSGVHITQGPKIKVLKFPMKIKLEVIHAKEIEELRLSRVSNFSRTWSANQEL